MNQGIRPVIYPVKEIAQAKTLYSTLLGKLTASVKDADGNLVGEQPRNNVTKFNFHGGFNDG